MKAHGFEEGSSVADAASGMLLFAGSDARGLAVRA